MNIKTITWEDVNVEIAKLKLQIKTDLNIEDLSTIKCYGVPRGGIPVSLLLGCQQTTDVNEAAIICDDLVDSGNTKNSFKQYNKPFYALFTKTDKAEWLHLPWEESDASKEVEQNVVRILQFLGDNPHRQGLLDTPKRFLKMMKELTTKPEFEFTVFDNEGMDQMVIVKDIEFTSNCEHHLALFSGYGAIAYVPNKKLVGISKLPRTLEYYARGLQNQERITEQVAERLMKELEPKGVAVLLEAKHSCMGARGVKKHESSTITSSMKGCFNEINCRQEFLNLIK